MLNERVEYPDIRDEPGADWRHKAACSGGKQDPELFFPLGESRPALKQIEAAKAVCKGCVVIEICLKEALDTGQDAGVWGGLSESERRALKRRVRRQQFNS